MKKLITVLLTCVLLLLPVASFAQGAQVTVNGNTVKVGEEGTITVTYSGDNIGRVSGMLEYDTSTLSYISGGSSEGDAGSVQLKKAGTGGSIQFQLKLKGVKEGTSSIKISTYEVYNLDEQPMETPATEENIQITAEKGTDGGSKDQETTPKNSDRHHETSSKDSGNDSGESDFNTVYLLVGGIILVLVLMIMAMALRKKRKSSK